MPTELSEQIGAALDAGGGDTEPVSTPVPAPAPETPEVTEPTPEPDTGSETAPTGEEEWKFDQAEFDKAHPELAPYRKQLQADYTRRTQEIAEQRKQFEAVDPGALQWAQYVRGLMQTNPAEAAKLLRQEAEAAAAMAPPASSPYEQQQWGSEGERFLAERLQQVERIAQQAEVARHTAEIDRGFAEIETAYQAKIPFEDRQKVCQFCLQNNIPDVRMGWKIMNYDRALQTGRDQASRVVTQKAGMPGPPAGVANREEPTTREPKSVKEALEMALAEAE